MYLFFVLFYFVVFLIVIVCLFCIIVIKSRVNGLTFGFSSSVLKSMDITDSRRKKFGRQTYGSLVIFMGLAVSQWILVCLVWVLEIQNKFNIS